MVDTELDSFIDKFKQLWRRGAGAHLYIDTHAVLNMRLGHQPGDL